MSSTTYTVSPSSLYDHRDRPRDQTHEPHHVDVTHHVNHSATAVESQLLSPYSSQARSNSASPTANSNAYTPAESTATSNYQPSDFSSDFDDPFFGVNFNELDHGTPTFLDDQLVNLHSSDHPVSEQYQTLSSSDNHAGFPLTFGKAPAEPTSMPSAPQRPQHMSPSVTISQQQHSNHYQSSPIKLESNPSAPQLTPDTNGGGWSSDDSLAPATLAMAAQSPRVTVSMWGRDGENPVHTVERSFALGAESPSTVRAGMGADDVFSTESVHGSTVSRDTHGSWVPVAATGHGGLAPEDRPSGETLSINELAQDRQVQEKNQDVAAWVSEATETPGDLEGDPLGSSDFSTYLRNAEEEDNISPDEIPLGHTTVNRHVAGQAYYHTETQGAGITPADLEIIQQSRNWADAPLMHPISQIDSARHQPQTSQAAIEKFERMYNDNESIVSRAATWGTRRRSLPSVVDVEGIISGNFLKRLTIRGEPTSRRSSLLRKLPSVRKTSVSQLLKRKGSNADDAESDEAKSSDRRASRDSLAPPTRTSSWGIKQRQTPSLNTALLGMGTGAATIGTSHARSGSISATSISSPKSPFGFPAVKNTLRRPRSKTELPKGAGGSHPNLVGMLKKQGGPPVAQLARTQQPALDPDDDDDDDEDLDDPDMKFEASKMEDIIPTFQGFQQHVSRLNPGLAEKNPYLVDRIAHQMIVRLKGLQNAKIKHLKSVNQRNCSCGQLCIALGGSARPLESRGADPLSARPDSSDGDITPLDGGINSESFPSGIPMPPTSSLPAEFECQLCFNAKKFQKPSDWTKHVHEDVQPFTCTWDRCRDPKMFKRKADWVRHENEGHRHLEWWTCDVEDCRHTCYRRDNFLQHLVREHKFTEPKVKTKAAIKKAGGGDVTWQKVERCHVETSNRPQDEPCRFCSKTFPTWKKLTVHLAKHMEQISLPVLKLVAAKQLEPDTIISPVQDPPPRHFGSLPPPMKQEPQAYHIQRPHALSNPSPVDYQDAHNPFAYHEMARAQLQNPYYSQHQTQQFDSNPQNQHSGLMMPQVTTGFTQQQQYHSLPVSTAASFGPQVNAFMPLQNQVEPFPTFNPLGLHDTNGAQLSYDTLADPTMQSVEQYSSHGSVSPYSHSPHQGHGGFYNP